MLLPPSPLLWAPDCHLTSVLTHPQGVSQLARPFECGLPVLLPPSPPYCTPSPLPVFPCKKTARHLPRRLRQRSRRCSRFSLSWPLTFTHQQLLSHLVPNTSPSRVPSPFSISQTITCRPHRTSLWTDVPPPLLGFSLSKWFLGAQVLFTRYSFGHWKQGRSRTYPLASNRQIYVVAVAIMQIPRLATIRCLPNFSLWLPSTYVIWSLQELLLPNFSSSPSLCL